MPLWCRFQKNKDKNTIHIQCVIWHICVFSYGLGINRFAPVSFLPWLKNSVAIARIFVTTYMVLIFHFQYSFLWFGDKSVRSGFHSPLTKKGRKIIVTKNSDVWKSPDHKKKVWSCRVFCRSRPHPSVFGHF